MMNIVSIFLITDINFLFSGFWGKMNDGSYRAVSTITREQAPKEAASQYSRHSREFLWKERFYC